MGVIKLGAGRVEMGLVCQMKALAHTYTRTHPFSFPAQEQKNAVHASDFRDVMARLPSSTVQVERIRKPKLRTISHLFTLSVQVTTSW